MRPLTKWSVLPVDTEVTVVMEVMEVLEVMEVMEDMEDMEDMANSVTRFQSRAVTRSRS